MKAINEDKDKIACFNCNGSGCPVCSGLGYMPSPSEMLKEALKTPAQNITEAVESFRSRVIQELEGMKTKVDYERSPEFRSAVWIAIERVEKLK